MLWRHALAHFTDVPGCTWINGPCSGRRLEMDGLPRSDSLCRPAGTRCRADRYQGSVRTSPGSGPRLTRRNHHSGSRCSCAASVFSTRNLEAGSRRVGSEYQRCRAGADASRACNPAASYPRSLSGRQASRESCAWRTGSRSAGCTEGYPQPGCFRVRRCWEALPAGTASGVLRPTGIGRPASRRPHSAAAPETLDRHLNIAANPCGSLPLPTTRFAPGSS